MVQPHVARVQYALTGSAHGRANRYEGLEECSAVHLVSLLSAQLRGAWLNLQSIAPLGARRNCGGSRSVSPVSMLANLAGIGQADMDGVPILPAVAGASGKQSFRVWLAASKRGYMQSTNATSCAASSGIAVPIQRGTPA